MKVYSVLLLIWKGEFRPFAGPLKVCSSLEQAKEEVKRVAYSKLWESLCYKLNKDGTGAKSLCDYRGCKFETRIFVSDIDVAPERLGRLDFYIGRILADKISSRKVYKGIVSAIEDNKVRVMFEGTVHEYLRQDVSDDELKELRKFGEKIPYTNFPKIKYTDPSEIYYIDSFKGIEC